MPDYMKKPNGDADWTKLFMAIATAIVVVMEGYSQMQNGITKDELKKIEKSYIHKDVIVGQYMTRDDIHKLECQKQVELLEDKINNLQSELNEVLKVSESNRGV